MNQRKDAHDNAENTDKIVVSDAAEKRRLLAQAIVRKHKALHPYKSTSQIAAEWNISQATLNRIERGQTNLSLDFFIKLIIRSKNSDNIVNLLNDSDPGIISAFIQSYDSKKNLTQLHASKEKYFADDKYHYILMHAYTRRGITLEEVKERLGIKGLEAVNELLEIALVEKDASGKISGISDHCRLKGVHIFEVVMASLKYFRPKDIGKFHCAVSHQTESLNKEAIIKYKELLKRQFIERDLFLNEINNSGDYTICTSLISHTYNENDSD